MASSLFCSQYKVLLDVLWDLFDVILFAVCFSRSDQLWVYDQDYLWTIFESSKFFYVWLVISASLFELSVWFGLLDWSFLQWEKCLDLGSILQCPFPVTVGEQGTYCIVTIKDKKMGFISYCMSLSLYFMSSCLKRYSVLMNVIL